MQGNIRENTKIGIAFVVGLACGVFGPGLIAKAKAADLGGSASAERTGASRAGPGPGFVIYGGVHGGMSVANTEVSSPLLPGFSIDGLGSHGWTGGLHAGIDYRFGGGMFGGLFGGYDWQNTEFAINTGGPAITVGLGDSWNVGGRLGYDWGTYKAYGLAAWRNTNVEWGVPAGALTGVSLPSTLNGLDLGIGGAMAIAQNVELGLEGIWTHYETGRISLGGSDLAKLDTDQLSVLARLSFKLGTSN